MIDAATWLAAHPARGDGPVRAQPIPRTHAPERVAVFAAMRDAAVWMERILRHRVRFAVVIGLATRAARAQAMLERGRGE